MDAPLDVLVERTHNRPIPRAAVSSFAATVFTATQTIGAQTQLLGAALFLPYLSSRTLESALYAMLSIIVWIYHSWDKRHPNVPQLVLGFYMAWGIFMGSSAIGLRPCAIGVLGSDPRLRMEFSTLCLFGANVFWPMIYDTIYADQDLEDDLKAGIKNEAVLYHDLTKVLYWLLLAHVILLLLMCGWLSKMGVMYYVIAVGGTTMSLGLAITRVDLKSRESCCWWFGNGFWLTGGFVAGGLLLEYLCERYLYGSTHCRRVGDFLLCAIR